MDILPSEPRIGTRSATQALYNLLNEAPAMDSAHAATGTGFQPLDRELNGGLLPGSLTLLGGAPGAGKTITALQWARNIARSGRHCMYACYEHDERELLLRLLTLEASASDGGGIPGASSNGHPLRRVRLGEQEFRAVVDSQPAVAKACEELAEYGENLSFVRASGTYHGVEELAAILDTFSPDTLLFVDYLQKMSVRPEPHDEAEKVTAITEALKELALTRHIPVVAVVAADRTSLDAKRLRLHHLRGSSALAYESDVVILLNDKRRIVAKAHLAYDALKAETYSQYVVFTIEKNRHGPAMIDVEFKKDFANFRFDPEGRFVAERLVDERLNEE